MERRKFIKAGVIGAAAVPLATPAIAQGVMQWKMVTAWPKNLPGPGVAAQILTKGPRVLGRRRAGHRRW